MSKWPWLCISCNINNITSGLIECKSPLSGFAFTVSHKGVSSAPCHGRDSKSLHYIMLYRMYPVTHRS